MKTTLALITAACLLAAPVSHTDAAAFANGSFELGPTPGSFVTLNNGDTSITGWTVVNGDIDYVGSYWVASDGTRSLEIAGLSTSDGPDLRVWLTDQAVSSGTSGWRVFDDGLHLELGKLKGNRGNQVYPIPASADLGAYRSVTIWCIRFSVSFGAATLA